MVDECRGCVKRKGRNAADIGWWFQGWLCCILTMDVALTSALWCCGTSAQDVLWLQDWMLVIFTASWMKTLDTKNKAGLEHKKNRSLLAGRISSLPLPWLRPSYPKIIEQKYNSFSLWRLPSILAEWSYLGTPKHCRTWALRKPFLPWNKRPAPMAVRCTHESLPVKTRWTGLCAKKDRFDQNIPLYRKDMPARPEHQRQTGAPQPPISIAWAEPRVCSTKGHN